MSQIEDKPERVADEEPPKKKTRMHSQARPVVRKPKPRKCKKVIETPPPPPNLCDLPTEILERIIGNINIWHHNRIRGTCKRLKYVNDIFVMHEFQKAIQQHTSQDPKSEASAALRVIKLATEVFVQTGFESVFCGCILPMLRNCYRDPFSNNFSEIQQFLVHFYSMVTDLMADISAQRWRLLYTITLMQLIGGFNKSILSSSVESFHQRVVFELRGPWMGTLWSSRDHTLNLPRHRCNLLIILAEMLISHIMEKGFKYIWDSTNEIYVFGNDTSQSSRAPRTLFTFTVYGSKKICNLLCSYLEEGNQHLQQTSKWPNDQFTINLDIICKEAMKWGCSKSQHMELGPFSKNIYDDNNNGDETENNLDDVWKYL